MTQTALNTWLALPADTWTLVSEVNCTFVVVSGTSVEILGMDGAAPDTEAARGVPYAVGFGEDAATDTLARFAGAGTADRLYAISRGENGALFVSRAAVT